MKEILKGIRPIHIGLLAIWIYAFISAILRPLLNDNMVFFAWAQQVYDSPLSGMDAIESVWEIKGLFSRIIYYQLYWLTQFFSSTLYPNGQYIYQAFGYVEISLLIVLSLYLLPNRYLSLKEKICSFFIISAAFFLSTPMAALQPEQWGICLLLVSTALLLRDNVYCSIVGGALLGLTLFVKTPFLLLSGSVFFAYMLIKQIDFVSTIRAIWIYALSALISIVIILGLLYMFYPVEIQDIKDASHYQSTLFSYHSIIPIIRDLGHSMVNMWQIPVYLPILIIGALSSAIYLSSQSLAKIVTLLLVWLFPYLYVVASNCYFQYHFVTFFFPAFIAIYLIKDELKQSDERKVILVGFTTLLLGVLFSFKPCYFIIRLTGEYFFVLPYLLICMGLNNAWKQKALLVSVAFSIFIFVSWNSLISHMHREEVAQINECIKINANNNHYQNQVIEDNDSILTLDAGVSHLWIANASYLRHFYPLPLQRTSDSSDFILSETYIHTKERVLKYSGNVIFVDTAWFFGNSKQIEVREFIDANYSIVDSIVDITNSGYSIYAKHPTEMSSIYIYKRKE